MKTLASVLLLSCCLTVHAAERVALVIGNDAYLHARPLNAAVNDAAAVADTLRGLGFDTTFASNTGLEQMLEALESLKVKAVGAKAAVVYYAGHGIESQGMNYLIPVDAKLEKEIQLQTQSVNLNGILDKLTALSVPARMVILDCCRDNPLEGRAWLATRSSGGGLGELAVQNLAAATLVVYSASPGKPALDRVTLTDRHSPFTQALLDTLPQAGVHSFEVFSRVEEEVVNRTEGRQAPRLFYNGSTLPFRNFRFATGEASAPPLAVAPAAVADTPPGPLPALPSTAPLGGIGAPVLPADLPASGYFDLESLFASGPYAAYNRHSKSQILMRVQQKLKEAGLYAGAVDGGAGPRTQAALNAWQQANVTSVTGRINLSTVTALGLSGLPEQSAPVSRPSRPGTSSNGPARPAATPAKPRSGGDMSVEEFMRRARALEGS